MENLDSYSSRGWDMDISLCELVSLNPKCYIDRNYKRHSTDDCYDGYCMYLKHPTEKDYTLMIGIYYDGFTYLGDGTVDKTKIPKSNTQRVLKEMYTYGEYIKIKQGNLHKEDILC